MRLLGDNVLDLPARVDGGLPASRRLCLAWVMDPSTSGRALSAREFDAFRRVYLADDAEGRAALHSAVRGDPRRSDRLVLGALTQLAARLGEEWCDGAASFVDVTIGCAHVHETLRAVGEVLRPAPDGACLVLAVPRGEDHVLPMALAAYRLRRAGLHARLLLDATAGGIARACRETAAEGVLIGAATDRGFARAVEIVRALRRTPDITTPVALGGGALRHHLDIAEDAGAACLSNDLQDALGCFGIEADVPAPAGARTAEAAR